MHYWNFHKKQFVYFLVILFYTSNRCVLYAQTDTTKIIRESILQESTYKSISGLIAVGGGSSGRVFNTNLIYHKSQHVYALRYLFATEKKIGVDFSNYSAPYEEISELGIYYGRQKKWTKVFIGTIGGGISYVQGIKRGKYVYTRKTFFADIDYHEEIQFKSPGLIMDARIDLLLGRYFNLNLNGVADLNLFKSFYGIGLGIGFNIPFNKK